MKKKRKPRKETGVGVSSLAGAWLNKFNQALKRLPRSDSRIYLSLTRADVRELTQVCASALSQDETKGQN